MNKKNLFALILIFINFFSFSQSLSDGLKELFFKVNVSSILKEADDNTIMAISKLPSDFTNLLMRISWNFENGPSTYFDLIYKKERGTIESLLADKIDLPVENISEFLKNFSIPPDSDFDYYKSEINIFEEEKNDLQIIESVTNIQDEKSVSVLDLEDNLSYFNFSDETFSLQKNNSSRIITNSDGKKSVRCYFDEKFRLEKKEIWNISDLINSSIIKTEVYNYSLDNLKPDSIEILEGKAKTVLIYNSDGKVSEKKIYAEESLENEDENEKKYILNEEIFYLYDFDFRLVEKKTILYNYESAGKNKNVTKNLQKEVFSYEKNISVPDYFYYENGSLKKSVEYKDSVNYNESIFFEDDFSVESYVSNGKRTKDLFYKNGILIRRKVYE